MTELEIERAIEVIFLDEDFSPCEESSSSFIKVVYDNGTVQLLQWE